VAKKKQSPVGEAGEQLRERDEIFRLISDNVTDLIAVIDKEGRRLYNSASYRNVLGDPESIIGTNSFAEIHPDERGKVQDVFRETLASGVGQRTEYRFVLKDGSMRHVESVGNVIRDALGVPCKVVVVSRDITERKRSEEALRESEQRYKRLLGSTTDYIFTVVVETGRPVVTSHGPGCIAVTGYTPAEFEADPCLWQAIMPEEDRAMVMEMAAKVVTGKSAPPLEHRIIHKSGAMRWVRSTAVAHKDTNGNVISYDGLVSDVTERKRAEQRLAAQYAVARVLAEAASLDEATPRLLQAACEGLGWEVGDLWRVDAAADVLRCVAVWHKPSLQLQEFEVATRELTFQRGFGLPGRIWASGKPAWVENVVGDANFPRAFVAAKEGLHGAFGFPILLGGKVLGVAEFFSREILQPDEDMIQMTATIGSQVGQFIERKQVEEALAQERNLLRTLIDNLPDLIYVKDAQSRFLIANEAIVRHMGAKSPTELLGKTDTRFYPKPLAERYLGDEQNIIGTGKAIISKEEPTADAAGSARWLSTTKVPLRDPQGRIIGIVGVGRDITEHKRAEEALRQSEERLQAILDNTTAVIYLKDSEGRYLLVNRWFEKLFHIQRGAAKGRSDYELFPQAMAEAFRANDRKVLEAGLPLEFEEIAPHDDGPHTYISIKFPLVDPIRGTRVLCGISTDITERKRGEARLAEAYGELAHSEASLREALADLKKSHEELKDAQMDLIQAAKMDSVGKLAAGVAHEVKNPLQIILMGVRFLSGRVLSDDENVQMTLAEIGKAVVRADTIVHLLLDLSAPKQMDIKDEDLNTVVEDSLRLVKFEMTSNQVSLVKELAATQPLLRVDRMKMGQVFINLFQNAIHAMPGGGTMTVKTFLRELADTLRFTSDTSHFHKGETVAVVEIEDTGGGIPEDQLPRIFDPFFTTKPTGKGTGLGLTIVKNIIEMHGGKIDIRNLPDLRGARVTIILKTKPK